ncbi:MAG: pitrilysin family protein [Bacteroidetes bacterium]|nr:pitrilysin family protein [Bacteroidota bacterium]
MVIILLSINSCNPENEKATGNKLSIEFEKYTLDNGLQVVLHLDKSDPIVSTAILYHVGSNREVKGRTGFAHLFEHMLFQESENVGQDQFFKKIQDAGGTLNGGTWKDGTIYYEVVPKSALEMVMWLESDRMGYMINTVTEAAFVNQQEVVQNEKRQRVDNNPYGHTNWVIDKNIFPDDHPYNWQVIGELVDLQSATVPDVKEFYSKFYGANNATLVLAGDFETEEAKALIEKYFGELKSSNEVPALEIQNVTLTETKRLYHEDNFAKAAQLNMVWPSVQQFHPDQYALDFLSELISDGKKAPLYKVLVKEKELTSETRAFNNSMEIAGKFQIRITANSGKNLNDIEGAIFEAFERFETEGVTDRDLERVKAKTETNFYNGINSILGKSFQLASYNTFAGDPGFITQDIENIQSVTKEDVMRVYEKYIKDKPYVITSFVPKGQVDMIAENSEMANVVEEEIKENVEKQIAEAEEEIQRTPSKIDRSIEPEQGTVPELRIPESWKAELSNGLQVHGIEHAELPLVRFNLVIKAGHLMDTKEKVGVANLMTDIMMEGTVNKTPEELEEEIDLLGANISMFTGNQSITIRVNTLSRNFDKTLNLIEEILLEPRWDEEEFDRIKTMTLNTIKRQGANPNIIASTAYNRLLYGEDHMLGHRIIGTEESVESITLDDLKTFYDEFFSPATSRFHIVGNVNQDLVMDALKNLENMWVAKEVEIPEYALPSKPDDASLYFVDIPNAKQSVIRIGTLGMKRTDPDYYPARVMNYKLGGSFSGNVNLILREEKGYTYGARTFFSGSDIIGTFTASSSVRTNVTYESVQIFREEIEKYREGIEQNDLDFTKNAMIKSNARRFETLNALLNMIQVKSAYNLPDDYIRLEEDIIREMTLERHKELAQKYLDPDKMVYLVAGDAATQFDRFKDAGFDKLLLIDKDANPVEIPIKIDVVR